MIVLDLTVCRFRISLPSILVAERAAIFAVLEIYRKMIETDALILKAATQPFELQKVLIDSTLQEQDVLVEILATGICHTDIGVQKLGKFPGKFPRILGHEGNRSM
jgi:Alcohol dehydrogenase GroES-like domain